MIKKIARILGKWFNGAVVILGVLSGFNAYSQAIEKNVQFTKIASVDFSQGGLNSTLPSGLSDQITGPVKVGYSYGVDPGGAKYLLISVVNNAKSEAGHYALFFGGMIEAKPGFVYRSAGSLKIDRGGFQGGVALGYHLFGRGGEYLTEITTPYSRANVYRAERQELRADYIGGTQLDRVGGVPASIFPRISIQNILPGTSFAVRVYGLNIERGEIRGVAVAALPVRQSLKNGGLFKISVNLMAKIMVGEFVSTLRLIDSSGVVKYQASHAGSQFWSGTTGAFVDAWQFKLPELDASGLDKIYKINYELRSAGSSVRMLPLSNDVVEQDQGGKYAYDIGSVSIGPAGGALIGASFHHYPASSLGDSEASLGGVKLKYQFSRSYANDHTYLPWWSFKGDGISYDWKAFERWALSFSRAGDKSLLIVFNGTPASGSSDENSRKNAMERPGWSAPPKDLNKFERVVYDTVSRYKDRIFAVECWNEPDVPGFFSGTQTDIANICKRLHQAVKRVDGGIPVICPQTPNPDSMGYVLSAKTSAGEPLTNYCDWIGAHLYQGMGRDPSGKAYASESLNEQVATIRRQMAVYGLTKPIAVTEFGIDRCITSPAAGRPPLDQFTDAQKADAVYQSIATLVEEGVKVVTLYSYDLAYVPDATCFRGGYLWTTNGKATAINDTVVRRINDAVSDVGAKKPSW